MWERGSRHHVPPQRWKRPKKQAKEMYKEDKASSKSKERSRRNSTENEVCGEGLPARPQVELTNPAESELFPVPGVVVTLNSIPVLRSGFPVIPSVAIYS